MTILSGCGVKIDGTWRVSGYKIVYEAGTVYEYSAQDVEGFTENQGQNLTQEQITQNIVILAHSIRKDTMITFKDGKILNLQIMGSQSDIEYKLEDNILKIGDLDTEFIYENNQIYNIESQDDYEIVTYFEKV